MLKKFFNNEQNKLANFSWRRVWIVVIVFVVLVSICFVGTLVYAHNYKDKVLPGVYLGGVHIGGMDQSSLASYLQNMNNKLLDDGIHFSFVLDGNDKDFVIFPTVSGEDISRELVRVDIEKEVKSILNYRKNNNILADAVSAILVRVSKPDIGLEKVEIDKEAIFEEIKENLRDYVSEPKDAGINIKSLDPLDYDITSSTSGFSFDYEKIAGHIVKDWTMFKSPIINIVSASKPAKISEEDVSSIVAKLGSVLDDGDLDISFTDPHNKKNYKWTIDEDMISDWIVVDKNEEGSLVFALDASSTKNFLLDKVASSVNVEAENARFDIGTNGKVTEFSGSRPGVTLDEDETFSAIQDAFVSRNFNEEGLVKNVTLTVKQVEPDIKTGEVNDLGISEVLGMGHSKFNGSPANRVKNISHAVNDKLDGLLIKPNENFSLVQALKPFTIADGYLPELVIKGDEIKPEVAGGLCQIGTTMFRAAMNSGLKITERRNHSLVVSYYNDLSNGNPGTDATIYDPNPDFRFLNDTGNYILVTTELNVKTYDLYIYFWGTNDGRKASYTPPVVSRWIAAGADKTIETTNLAPGVRECQLRHEGAETSFTYTRVLADGKKENVVFDSYYRPLPKICLVGVEPKKEEEVVPAEVVPESSEVIPPFDITDTILN